MSRQKMALERIPDDVARHAAFRNLLNILTEKAGELATLCNAKVCGLVYAEGEAQPVVWPSVAEAVPILQRFKATPEIKQYNKSVTQEDFLRQRMDKLKLQIQKSAPENNRRDTALLLHKAMRGQLQGGLEGLGIEKLTSVGWMVHMRLKGLRELIVKREEQAALQLQPLPAPASASISGLSSPNTSMQLDPLVPT
ncbi:hypothetical protein BRADI_1g55041v3 [Brachypodium distachyon]|uniref:MADS-box domain-containing protein n=1 Tax=Brachypodium distachyon TaxID=15368 RepID=A0A0Q3NSS4_BRADI|nr:hypothetical protein BRADI_1g55041v3 [Brachypodium distachyon]